MSQVHIVFPVSCTPAQLLPPLSKSDRKWDQWHTESLLKQRGEKRGHWSRPCDFRPVLEITGACSDLRCVQPCVCSGVQELQFLRKKGMLKLERNLCE